MTGLTSLDLYNFIADREESLDDVPRLLEDTLAAVPQLRALRVSFAGGGYYVNIPSFPTLLAAMRHLEHLYWDLTALEEHSLPPGDWLGSLLSLALPGDVIAHNAATLALAQRLHCLAALHPSEYDKPRRAPSGIDWRPGVVQLAASLPTVRRLDMVEVPYWGHPPLDPLPAGTVAAAKQRNPTLQIRTRKRNPIDDISLEQFQQWVGILPS